MNTVDWDTGFLVAHGAGEHWAALYVALQATQAEAVKTRQGFRRVKVVEADRASQVVLTDPTTQTRHLGINSCHADLKYHTKLVVIIQLMRFTMNTIYKAIGQGSHSNININNIGPGRPFI